MTGRGEITEASRDPSSAGGTRQGLKAKGLAVFGVNYAEDPATVRGFLAQNPLTIPVLLDEKGEVGQRYQATAIPTLVVIGKDGKVSSYFQGVREEDVLRKALAKAGIK